MGCCSRCSVRCFCVWLVGILANIIFIGAVGLSTYAIWPLGLALSVVYSASLWFSIFIFHKRMNKENGSDIPDKSEGAPDGQTTREVDDSLTEASAQAQGEVGLDTIGLPTSDDNDLSEESPASDSRSSMTKKKKEQKITFALSMLYLTAILSLAGPLVVLITKDIIHCVQDHATDYPERYWTTDLDGIPSALRAWASTPVEYDYSYEENMDKFFCQLLNTTYFIGAPHFDVAGHSGEVKLYVVSEGLQPMPVEQFKEPRLVTKVTEDSLCFVAESDERQYWDATEIVCGNKSKFQNVVVHSTPYALIGYDELLWFQQRQPEEYFDAQNNLWWYDVGNLAVVSINTTNMNQTVHSTLHTPNGTNQERRDKYEEDQQEELPGDFGQRHLQADCDYPMTRWQSFAGLLLVALPITIISARVWFKFAIPSASVTLYIGIGLICMCVSALMDPWDAGFSGLAFWFTFGSPVWIFVSAFQLITNPKVSKGPLRWGLHTVAFCVCTSLVLLLIEAGLYSFQHGYDGNTPSEDIVMVVCLFLLIFLPLALVGIAADSTFLYMEGVVGVVILTVSATVGFSNGMFHKAMASAVVVVVAEVLVLGAASWFIHRRRATLKDKLVASILKCSRHVCVVASSIDESEGETAELLVNENAEEA